jgi:hypothetical protein
MERRHPGGFCAIVLAIEAGKMPALKNSPAVFIRRSACKALL